MGSSSSPHHVLVNCSGAQTVWLWVGGLCGVSYLSAPNYKELEAESELQLVSTQLLYKVLGLFFGTVSTLLIVIVSLKFSSPANSKLMRAGNYLPCSPMPRRGLGPESALVTAITSLVVPFSVERTTLFFYLSLQSFTYLFFVVVSCAGEVGWKL